MTAPTFKLDRSAAIDLNRTGLHTMALIDSLLSAIVRLDGDALVMHVGEKPYVVTSRTAMNEFRGPLVWGQVELSSKLLTYEAVSAMVDQLLPREEHKALQEVGAVEYELSQREQDSRFVVIAARGGQDIWLEIRHVRPTPAAAEAQTVAEPPPATTAEAPLAETPAAETPPAVEPTHAAEPVPQESPAAQAAHVLAPLETPQPIQVAPPEPIAEPDRLAEPERSAEPVHAPELEPIAEHIHVVGPEPEPEPVAEQAHGEESVEVPEPVVAQAPAAFIERPLPVAVPEAVHQFADEPVEATADVEPVNPVVPIVEEDVEERVREAVQVFGDEEAVEEHPAAVGESTYQLVSPSAGDIRPPEAVSEFVPPAPSAAILESEGQLTFQQVAPIEPEPPAEIAAPAVVTERDEPAPIEYAPPEPAAEPHFAENLMAEPMDGNAAVVVPITRVVREQAPPPPQVVAPSDLDRLLRIAAGRGASALYAVARAKPVVRVDGEMQTLDAEEALTPQAVEAFMMAVAQEPTREAMLAGETTEWICDMAEVGRVRCLSFHDHRGPGVIFRMLPPRAISAEQLGLSKEVQALSAVPDGLVLLVGPRGSGTSTLVAAFIDLVNRTRSEHVVTIESQILFLHEPKRSFVSQREVRGQGDEIAAAARAALREDPDVLVIEELASPDAVAAAVDAAQSGRLVFAGLRAPAAGPALERLIEQTPAERRTQLRGALASTLRGVVVQALLRKRGGGRVAARELLLNTPAVAALIQEGKLLQLQAALQSGRRFGMAPLNDALADLVRSGVVDPSEAYRHAVERDGLLAQLRRDGLDTSFVERLA